MKTGYLGKEALMVSGINSTAEDNLQLMAQMYQKLNKADTDGISGLSKGELSSIETGKDIGKTDFLKKLQEQFDALDTDGNGQLSADEIAKLKAQNGVAKMPYDINTASFDEVSKKLGDLASSAGESLGKLTSSFVHKLMDSYKSGGLSGLSSINIAG